MINFFRQNVFRFKVVSCECLRCTSRESHWNTWRCSVCVPLLGHESIIRQHQSPCFELLVGRYIVESCHQRLPTLFIDHKANSGAEAFPSVSSQTLTDFQAETVVGPRTHNHKMQASGEQSPVFRASHPSGANKRMWSIRDRLHLQLRSVTSRQSRVAPLRDTATVVLSVNGLICQTVVCVDVHGAFFFRFSCRTAIYLLQERACLHSVRQF